VPSDSLVDEALADIVTRAVLFKAEFQFLMPTELLMGLSREWDTGTGMVDRVPNGAKELETPLYLGAVVIGGERLLHRLYEFDVVSAPLVNLLYLDE
jgi:hypothetical protein